jgi:hypothetical protein
MRIVFAIPETLVCAGFTIAGLYMLNEGMADKSANAPILVVSGAVFFAFGAVALQAVLRSMVWHRSMLRRAANHRAEPAPPLAIGHD